MAQVQVQLKLKQVGTGDPVELKVNVEFGRGERESGATEQDIRSTGEAIVGSVSVLAELDPTNELQDERESLQFETTDGEEETEGARYSKNELKDRFRNMGDNMQRQVEENAEKITRQENSANVMKELLEVFDGIFEVTEGRGVINSGRLVMALYLNYFVILKYFMSYGRAKLFSLLKDLIPGLVKYLVKIGLITWIIEVGGWIYALKIKKVDVVSLLSTSVPLLVFGTAWFAWKLVEYFRPRS